MFFLSIASYLDFGISQEALMLAEQLALCKDPAIADQAFALTQVHQM